MKVVEFSDVLCPHCATFEESLEELRGVARARSSPSSPAPPPLVDDGCEKPGAKDSTKDIRCVGAKVQIRSEHDPLYWDVRKAIFANQQNLRSSDTVLELAAKVTGRTPDALARANSPETQVKLREDITYARRYNLEGTPLVLLNGRETCRLASFSAWSSGMVT